jgi:hypothetical protein
VLSLLASCATAPDAKGAVGPCARARLAREFVDHASFEGCFVVVDGPDAVKGAGVVVLTSLPVDHLPEEPPTFRLATTEALLRSSKGEIDTRWEQLSTTTARLSWLAGTRGVEMCVEGDRDALAGSVVVVDDQPPFAHVVGRVTLRRTTCPS